MGRPQRPDFAKKIRLAERLKDWQAETMSGNQQSDQQVHIRALTPVGIASGMQGFDRVAARFGVEPRHPWSDKRLVEFYLRLPLRQKARDGWTKYLVRKALASSLDEDVRWHTGKDHLGRLFTRRLMNQSREQILSTLSTTDGPIGAYSQIGYRPIAPLGGEESRDPLPPSENTPDRLAEFASDWLDMGAQIVGGCCATTPAHIKAMSGLLD